MSLSPWLNVNPLSKWIEILIQMMKQMKLTWELFQIKKESTLAKNIAV